MTPLGTLRVSHADGLPFSREKLRACLVLAGLRQVYAGQVTAFVSQSLRSHIPAELEILLADDQGHLLIRPSEVAGRYSQIRLGRRVGETEVKAMTKALDRLTREELLHDLEHQVEERTAELEHERERSERLLRNMLPTVIAQRMKDGETIADTHEATVLFADIKGFTELARDRSATAVVAILDEIFRRIDALAEAHNLEKIKTIGDCYMAVAGLPLPQADHVDRAVMMALDIIAAMPQLRQELGVEIDVRIGVHTGPLVAGVIGTQKYAYDVWGDTVNVASRMESHGLPGHVQVSDDVRKHLGGRFEVEERGTIEIKNRGSMKTWFVHGLSAL
jgi:class 3 adenylate cyclase